MSATVTIPLDVAEMISVVYLPKNVDKARSAVPEVKDGVRAFRAAIEAAKRQEASAPQMAEALRAVLGYARSRAEDLDDALAAAASDYDLQVRLGGDAAAAHARRKMDQANDAARKAGRAIDAAEAALRAAGVEP